MNNIIKAAVVILAAAVFSYTAGKYYKQDQTLAVLSYVSQGIAPEVMQYSRDAVYKISPEGRPREHGSGFWVSDTKMITAYHVVNNPSVLYKVTNHDGTKVAYMRRISMDSSVDYALLTLVSPGKTIPESPVKGIKLLPLTLVQPRLGQTVYSIGYQASAPLVVTVGHMQGKLGPHKNRYYNKAYFLTSPVVGGGSGGPIITKYAGKWKVFGYISAVESMGRIPWGAIHIPHLVLGKDLQPYIEKDSAKKEK